MQSKFGQVTCESATQDEWPRRRHHGGAGTTTAAAMSGTPQVVLPQGYDQHYWAQRIEDLGI